MPIKRRLINIIMILSLVVIPSISFAGAQQSLGTDLIRLVDQAQDDGMLNINYQYSLTRNSAITAGFASGNDITLAEAGYKYYLGKYFDSAYGQAGLVIGDYNDDTEFGLTAALGYEKSLARHFVMGFGVEMTLGTMDHPYTNDRDPIFRPILNLIFAF